MTMHLPEAYCNRAFASPSFASVARAACSPGPKPVSTLDFNITRSSTRPPSILEHWKPSSCHIQSPALRIPHQLYLRVQLMVARCRTSPSVPRLRRCIRSWPHTKTILPTNGQGPNWLLKTYGDGHNVILEYILCTLFLF